MKVDDLRIAILTPYASSEFLGGMEVYASQLQQVFPRADILSVPGNGNGHRSVLVKAGLGEPRRALSLSRSFMRASREKDYDLIISNGVSGWPLSVWRPAVPAIQIYHLTLAGFARAALRHRGDRLTTGTVTAFFDRLAGVGKHVVAVSEKVLREVQKHYGHTGTVIQCAVDTQRFQPGDQERARLELSLPLDARIGLCVGRAEYAKGYDLLLEVCRAAEDVLFLIAGAGAESQGNLRALGRVPPERMPLVYAAADFFILPSRYEGFNLAVLEALACQLPLVVSRHAYPFKKTAPPFVAVVDRFDVDDLVEGIQRIQDVGLPREARAMVHPDHSLDAFETQWRAFVEQALGGDGHA